MESTASSLKDGVCAKQKLQKQWASQKTIVGLQESKYGGFL
jgi:hypothetical protein